MRPNLKHQVIYQELKTQLADGSFEDGERLPTEHELARRYGVSRPTVTRALNTLQSEGLIHRRTGSGSYVTFQRDSVDSRLFGLLMPSLGSGEIFEPISACIASLAEQNNYSLLWSGSGAGIEQKAVSMEAIIRRYIENRVSGVFFAPLEHRPSFDRINRNIVSLLESAGIPLVLIDTDFVPFPERSGYDLIGIDNFHSGYQVTRHFLEHGVRRVDFVARPYSSYTVAIRLRGYRAALSEEGIDPRPEWVHSGDPEDEDFVRSLIFLSGVSDVICGNDETAAALMHALERLSVPIPEQIRIIGFDDVRYAQLLKVPLTTLHQPCQEIGQMAVETMLWRVSNPGRPPRTVHPPGNLIIRRSCGCTT